jgi:hypothetical protein
MVLLLRLADGHQEIVALAPGEDPGQVAAKREAIAYMMFNSLREVVAHITGDMNQPAPTRGRGRPRRMGKVAYNQRVLEA